MCLCLSLLWVISLSHTEQSLALWDLLLSEKVSVRKQQGKQQLFINNPPGGRERAVLRFLNGRANSGTVGRIKVLNCRLD